MEIFSQRREGAKETNSELCVLSALAGESNCSTDLVVAFDAQEIFANLSEKEKIKGHHSPEGRAIRTLSRGLSGWSTGDLSAGDVVVLCDQAVEDWLKGRLKRSPWSAQTLPALAASAIKNGLMSRMDAVKLRRIRSLRARAGDEQQISKAKVERALEFCIELIEKHW